DSHPASKALSPPTHLTTSASPVVSYLPSANWSQVSSGWTHPKRWRTPLMPKMRRRRRRRVLLMRMCWLWG
ncbi:hypothetical protein HDV00_010019, partial [Rhizophlyctis rosea]